MVNNVCPPDEELLPMITGETLDDSIRSHLDACSSCRHRFESFRSDLAALKAIMPSTIEKSWEDPPPRVATIGKYLVCGRLDGGGQADVYRALHPTLDTEVAIKLGRKAVGRHSEQRSLLVAEGKLLAKLEHPNLARIFDLDFHEDQPFLAMEYIRGSNLRAYAQEHSLTPRTSARIVAQVARALAEVHRQGIVHMDIKPQNVLMDAKDQPRLIDFGLARVRHAWDDDGQGYGGTPAYMAPEQARGDSAAVGPRTDVFALGGVLYFLLTAKPPFQGTGLSETIAIAGRGQFDRAALDSPGIPQALRAMVLKAMALNPQDRYRSAEDFALELEKFVAAPARRKRLAIIAAAVVGGGGILFLAWSALRPPAVLPVVQPATYTPLEIQISRNGQPIELTKALPLQPETDRVQIVARVPGKQHVALFHVNAKGKVKRLPTTSSPGDQFTRYVFPAHGSLAEFDPAGSGTEFVLLVSADDPKAFENLEEVISVFTAELPPLPEKSFVEVSRDEPKRTSSTFGNTAPDAVAQVEAKLDYLRLRLLERKMLTIRGIAYKR
jgi:predicted Ser/Thr protein kinase